MDATITSNVFQMSDYRQRKLSGAEDCGWAHIEDAAGPVVTGFECAISGVLFPCIYRASYPELAQAADGKIVATGGRFVHFQLSTKLKFLNGTHPETEPASFVPINALSPQDHCWLEVYHFLSAEEAVGFGYAAARLQKRDDRSLIFSGEDGLFVLLIREDEPRLNGLITYHAQKRGFRLEGNDVECHSTSVGTDGSIRHGDPLDGLDDVEPR